MQILRKVLPTFIIIFILYIVLFTQFTFAQSTLNCSINGTLVPNGQSKLFYRKSSIPVSWGQSCIAYSLMRKCNNGVLTGGEPYAITGEYYNKSTCGVTGSPTNSNLGNKNWEVVFTDEGTGNNREEWAFSNGPEYYGGYRVPESVVYRDGKLEIVNRLGNRTPYPATTTIISGRSIKPSKWESAHMWTKEKFTYGYFEAKIKMAKAQSVDQAFWLRAGEREIDIVEAFYWNSTSDMFSSTLWGLPIVGSKTPSKGKINYYPDLSDGYHVYGLYWTPEKITFYFDGVEQYSITDPVYLSLYRGQALNVRLSTAVSDIFSKDGVPASVNNTEMSVDYVRVFKEI